VFDQAIRRMLSGAIVAFASLRGIEISDEAADFFAERALGNIRARNTIFTDQDVYDAALLAVALLPAFISKIQQETQIRRFASRSDAENAIAAFSFPCFYPWCE
jgi:hypothetical protein